MYKSGDLSKLEFEKAKNKLLLGTKGILSLLVDSLFKFLILFSVKGCVLKT